MKTLTFYELAAASCPKGFAEYVDLVDRPNWPVIGGLAPVTETVVNQLRLDYSVWGALAFEVRPPVDELRGYVLALCMWMYGDDGTGVDPWSDKAVAIVQLEYILAEPAITARGCLSILESALRKFGAHDIPPAFDTRLRELIFNAIKAEGGFIS